MVAVVAVENRVIRKNRAVIISNSARMDSPERAPVHKGRRFFSSIIEAGILAMRRV